MRVVTYESGWNRMNVDIPRLDEPDLDYVSRVLDCLEAFYRKNTSSNPPDRNRLSGLRNSLGEITDFANQPVGGNFDDMWLRVFDGVLDISFPYIIQVRPIRESPSGIHISCHKDSKRVGHMAMLKLLWEDFEFPISS